MDKFYKFLKENGIEAFDKMAEDVAQAINGARVKFEEEEKAKEGELAKALKKGKKSVLIKAIADLVNDYYGDDMEFFDGGAEMAAKCFVESIDEVLDDSRKVREFLDKAKVEVKDKGLGDETVRIVKMDLSDLSEEEVAEFFNGLLDD